MNNPTWVDKITGQIPGKTEGVSIFALLMNLVFGALSLFFGIDFSAETIATLNGLLLSIIGATLGAKVSRVETTTNQVQASQTAANETIINEVKK